MRHQTFHLIGYASGIAGASLNPSEAPSVIQHSAYLLNKLHEQPVNFHWQDVISPHPGESKTEVVSDMCTHLANTVSHCIAQDKNFCVIGGDHSAAIGTWSGVYDAYHSKGDIGLIWIDAHMDSHTPETTPSGNIHGMPLASLLGHGDKAFTDILHRAPKFKAENVCLIGVRSFEAGEKALLERLNVRIYYMTEVKERGLSVVMEEALQHVKKNTVGFGVSLDIDSIDPLDAPAVDVPEKNGIAAKELLDILPSYFIDEKFIAGEIVEFSPSKDKDDVTQKLVVDLLFLLAGES